MKTLRTPDECFQNLPGFPYEPHYSDVPDGEGSTLRIHHIDEGPKDGQTILCMHGQPTWSYLYRHMIPILVGDGLRVLAPDLVGFGRSDKPAAREDYSYNRQVLWLGAWLRENDVTRATLVGQDWGGLGGLRMVAENPERFDRVVAANTGLPLPQNLPDERIEAVRQFRSNAPTPTIEQVITALQGGLDLPKEHRFAYWQKWTWETEELPIERLVTAGGGPKLSVEEVAAYDAPFPEPSYQMGPRAMPSLVPTLPDNPSLPQQLTAWTAFSEWTKPVLCIATDNDPVTREALETFKSKVPGARGQPHITIEGGGHFLQESRGVMFAKIIAGFVLSAGRGETPQFFVRGRNARSSFLKKTGNVLAYIFARICLLPFLMPHLVKSRHIQYDACLELVSPIKDRALIETARARVDIMNSAYGLKMREDGRAHGHWRRHGGNVYRSRLPQGGRAHADFEGAEHA